MAITRVSTAADGTQANGNSVNPVFSPDGTKVLFTSDATNLVPGDGNGRNDVFLKDLGTGAVSLVSASADGTPANFGGAGGAYSPDGQQVAFTSSATNLAADDTNGASDVYVKNLATNAVTRISTATDGSQGNGTSDSAAFSPDGTKFAFRSMASNLVADDTNNAADIFVKNLSTGVLTRVNTAADGTQTGPVGPNDGGTSFLSGFSPDGQSITFSTSAPNLVPNDTNGVSDIFIKNLNTGAITRVSTTGDGSQAVGGGSSGLVFSPDGTRIAFTSAAENLVPNDTNGLADVFVKDLTTGAVTRVSTRADGSQANGQSIAPRFSPDGTKVLFQSSAALDPTDTNNANDIYEKNLTTGAITRVSVPSNNLQADSVNPTYSNDGTKIAFNSFSNGFVPNGGDTNNRSDVFVADAPCFCTGTRIRTARGEVAVEVLRVGDLAVTASGALRPITWIGSRRLDGTGALPFAQQPVRVRAGAFGPGVPARTLRLSPGHPVLVGADADGEGGVQGGVLVPVMCLINGTSIAREPATAVTYWHVELDSHDVLLAEGLPAESYYDMGSRVWFAGEDGVLTDPDLVPAGEHGRCRPVAIDGPLVEAERLRLDAMFAAELAGHGAWSGMDALWPAA